jgi:uncharacterized protein (DUF433 family)
VRAWVSAKGFVWFRDFDILLSMTKGVSMDSSVCHGKPVIEGTRVLVSTILGALVGGDTHDMVAEDYQITSAQISAALEFAAGMADFKTASYDEVA